MDSVHAESTRRAYAHDWADFTAWASAHDLSPLPADPDTVVAYLEHCAERLRPATIHRRLAAIAAMHRAADHTPPTSHPAVRRTLQAIRRRLGTAPQQKQPITLVQLRQMVGALDGPTAVRDRALLLLGFVGAFRRAELVALDVEDLEEREEGYLVHVRRSKTDQEGRGAVKPIPHGQRPETCPVLAVRAWLAQLEEPSGPLFRQLVRGRLGARLSGAAVARTVKRAAERVGIDPAAVAGHSLRAGFVTEAFEAGMSEIRIAEQTGHKSMDVLRGYIRRQDPFRGSAAGQLGL